MERYSTQSGQRIDDPVPGPHNCPAAAVNNSTEDERQAEFRARYADLLARFDEDLVRRHRGLLRHATTTHYGVLAGRYALAPVAGARRGWVVYEVEGFDGEPRLADHRLIFRRGRAGMFEVVPRRQIDAAFTRIAECAELAAARYRLLCRRCGQVSGEARDRGLCETCREAVRLARVAQVAYRQQKEQRDQARRHEIERFRRRVLGLLARHPEGLWRSELAGELGIAPGSVEGKGYRLNRALAELSEAAKVVVEVGLGPTAQGPRRQRRYRLAGLRVIEGGRQ